MAEETQGITAITVGGYKSICKETTIKIRPLTILAGANSSGKSSIMQPMLMMKQTLDATYDPGPLLMHGANVKFTKFEQMFPLSQEEFNQVLVAGFELRSNAFSFGPEISVRNEFAFGESNNGRKSISLSRMSSNFPKEDFAISLGMSSEEVLRQIPDDFIESVGKLRNNSDDNSEISWEIKPSRCFLYIRRIEKIETSDQVFTFEIQLPPPVNPAPILESAVANLIHIPGLRGNPLRTYPLAHAQGPRYPGHFQEYAASILLRWKEQGDKNFNLVEGNLTDLGLTKWVKPVRVDDANVEIHVGRLPVEANANPKEDLVSIADVGVGISQILPVLVALIAAEKGQAVYIEQPEMHLHPRAQVALASVLAKAAKRGVRVVIETHSSLLLQAVMTLIAQDELDHEDVMLHWFSRDEEGFTKVDSVEPDENGAYGDWPEDFGDVELEIMGKYLNAVGERDAVPDNA